MTRVKICGITSANDACAAAHSGADAIGLVFYGGSSRHVDIRRAAEICRALPPFVTTVALFVDASEDEVRRVLFDVPVDVLQFHGDESPDSCRQFQKPYIKAVRMGPEVDLLQYASAYASAQALLLDASIPGLPGGTGQTFDWRLARRGIALPIVLSGGLTAANVGIAIRAVRPWAVDVSSGVEASPGIKDATKIDEFIRGVRNADAGA
jgi:phosphoribosylanthranilate isomerase